MALSLGGLTVLAGAALAAVHHITADAIAEAALKARTDAMTAILPPFDNGIIAAADTLADGLVLYPATLGETPAGMALETFSDKGFSGRITLLAGFDNDGRLTGYRVLEHAETPGLGANMATWFTTEPHSIAGSENVLAVKADGGSVDAITGATITSRAFLEAINKARKAFENHKNCQK